MKHRKLHCITIDPGVELGYAMWRAPLQVRTANLLAAPLAAGVITSDSGNDAGWWNHVVDVVNQLALACYHWTTHRGPIDRAVIEWPQFFKTRAGLAAANSGSLVKLSCAVGAIAQGIREIVPIIQFVSVPEWKGQLPKEEVIDRIKRVWPDLDCSSHAWDAVGIGLHLQGGL